MNLFSRVFSLFSGAAQESREAIAEEARTPGQLAAWLSGLGLNDGSLKDPYGTSPWVSRAIKHIAGPISQVGLDFYQETPAGKVEIHDPAMEEFWNRPAKSPTKRSGRYGRLSRYDLIEATVGWLSLEGEFFWLLDDTWNTPNGAKSPLIIARPDRMRPILENGELLGWDFRDASGRSFPLIPDNVISSRFWNPNDDLRGLAPMDAAEMAAQADYASARFWKSLAESNGDLGETVIAPNGVTPEQQEQIKMMLRRKREAAKKGKYLPSFFVGDVKTEAAKIQSPDASAVSQRLQNRHEVFIAFGVPPSFAEVTASYSVGSASDRYKLIEETCMPIAAKIAEAIEMVEERRSGMIVCCEFDFDDHSTMQQVRSERIESGRKLHERGVPWSVISDHLNLGLKAFPGWDKAWLPFNLQEVSGPMSEVGGMETPPVEDSGVKVFEELEELLKGCPCHDVSGQGPVVRGQKDEKRAMRWEQLMRTRAPYVKKIRVVVDRALFEARKETLANIAAAAEANKAVRAGAFDFIFDLGRFIEMLVEPIFRILTESYQEAGAELLKDDMGSEEPFTVDPAGVARLQARKNFIQDAGQEMWELTRNSLEEGVTEGESFDKLAARVRETFNGMSKERSMRIAVTEIGIAFESGRHDAMIQAGAEWKQWLTSEDDRVRLSHWALNGKSVPIDEPFNVGGVPMMFPCDPNGTPAEIINCRCVHGPVSSPENPEGINNDPTVPF